MSPGFAIGVYGPMGEVASRGVRVAPFTFRGWMHAGMGYDDNVALSSANKRGSMFLTLHPALSIGFEGQSHRYFGVYRGGYAQYFSASSSNYENHNLTLQASDDWSTRLRTAFHMITCAPKTPWARRVSRCAYRIPGRGTGCAEPSLTERTDLWHASVEAWATCKGAIWNGRPIPETTSGSTCWAPFHIGWRQRPLRLRASGTRTSLVWPPSFSLWAG